MEGSSTLLLLQQYWWLIIAVLGGLYVFMLFVQGGQTLLHAGKTEAEEKLILNSLGRKWELTFTTLVLFGGALYAAFPLFYSISFGGAYWVWMAILITFVLQAVAYEYMNKEGNLLGKGVFKLFLYINGFVGVVVTGAAVGTFFTGSNFTFDPVTRELAWGTLEGGMNLRGLEAAIDISHGAICNVALGITIFFLVRANAAMYFVNNIDNANVKATMRKVACQSTLILLLPLLYVLGSLILGQDLISGWKLPAGSYLPQLSLFGFLPLILLLVGLVLFLVGVFVTRFKESTKGIWFAGLGTVLVGIVVFLIAGIDGQTAFYPSYVEATSSLTIQNASGSEYTLKTMAWVSVSVPFILAYIAHAWYQMNKTPITEDEVANDSHAY